METLVSPRSAALHSPAELAFVALDDAGEIAFFRSESKSDPATPNVTAIEIMTLDTFCYCKAGEIGNPCWHVAHVEAAWRSVAHQVRCARMDDEALEAYGIGLHKHVVQAEEAGQSFIAAGLREQLHEARVEWAKRAATPAAPTRIQDGIGHDLPLAA